MPPRTVTPALARPPRGRVARIAAGLVVLAVALSGCARGANTSPTADTVVEIRTESGSEAVVSGVDPAATSTCATPAADALAESELRAALEDLLEAHVVRTHRLVRTAAATGLRSEPTTAAYERLDANGRAIGGAIAGVYGDGAGDAFVALWRTHLQLFVDYAAGVASGDRRAARAADAGLRRYSHDFGAFIASATEDRLPADTVADGFDGHVDTVETMIDRTLAGSSAGGARRAATAHTHHLAGALSSAIAEQFPCRYPAA